MCKSIVRFSLYSLLLLALFSNVSLSQTNFAKKRNANESEVTILNGISTMQTLCFGVNNKIVDEKEFNDLKKDPRCKLLTGLNVNFAKNTLISYSVGGDCHMRVDTDVFRNDNSKTYRVIINNYWGRCRAGGRHRGWLVINKIPVDYKLKFEVKLIEHLPWEKPKPFRNTSNEFIKTEHVDLKGCVPMYRQDQYIINDKETYLKLLRRDTQTESCIKNAKNLNFDKFTYLGIQINSGYCRYPLGLEYKTIKNPHTKKYTLKISYIDPGNQTCRALSRYDLWVKVPKLPLRYKVKFEISPTPNK